MLLVGKERDYTREQSAHHLRVWSLMLVLNFSYSSLVCITERPSHRTYSPSTTPIEGTIKNYAVS